MTTLQDEKAAEQAEDRNAELVEYVLTGAHIQSHVVMLKAFCGRTWLGRLDKDMPRFRAYEYDCACGRTHIARVPDDCQECWKAHDALVGVVAGVRWEWETPTR